MEALGLGLAISNALVQAHGGTLTASSPGPGGGATFRVELETLPAGTATRPGMASRAREEPAPAGRRRVLFVEDHEDTRAAAYGLLTELSCDVTCASSIEEALAAAERTDSTSSSPTSAFRTEADSTSCGASGTGMACRASRSPAMGWRKT